VPARAAAVFLGGAALALVPLLLAARAAGTEEAAMAIGVLLLALGPVLFAGGGLAAVLLSAR
jgi:hypothetical protein